MFNITFHNYWIVVIFYIIVLKFIMLDIDYLNLNFEFKFEHPNISV